MQRRSPRCRRAMASRCPTWTRRRSEWRAARFRTASPRRSTPRRSLPKYERPPRDDMLTVNRYVAVVVFALLTCVVGLQVLDRLVLHRSFIWSEEIARFL